MAYTISDANASFTLAVTSLFPAPQNLQFFGADDAFAADNVKPTEVKVGVDGHQSIGYAAHNTPIKIKLAADSPSCQIFDLWYLAQKTTLDAYSATAVIKLPSIGQEYTGINGALTGYMPIAPAKKVLEEREFEITFESFLPAGI
jgi:hypothetical protein